MTGVQTCALPISTSVSLLWCTNGKKPYRAARQGQRKKANPEQGTQRSRCTNDTDPRVDWGVGTPRRLCWPGQWTGWDSTCYRDYGRTVCGWPSRGGYGGWPFKVALRVCIFPVKKGLSVVAVVVAVLVAVLPCYYLLCFPHLVLC